jgi:hypothetical protein
VAAVAGEFGRGERGHPEPVESGREPEQIEIASGRAYG